MGGRHLWKSWSRQKVSICQKNKFFDRASWCTEFSKGVRIGSYLFSCLRMIQLPSFTITTEDSHLHSSIWLFSSMIISRCRCGRINHKKDLFDQCRTWISSRSQEECQNQGRKTFLPSRQLRLRLNLFLGRIFYIIVLIFFSILPQD